MATSNAENVLINIRKPTSNSEIRDNSEKEKVRGLAEKVSILRDWIIRVQVIFLQIMCS